MHNWSRREQIILLNRIWFFFVFFSVNFQRIMPKSCFFKGSEVLKQLNEEAIKTKKDKDKEVRKWTTFLQKPDRPIPKSRQQLELQSEPYRVRIVKQPKPMCDPNRVRTPPPASVEPPPSFASVDRAEEPSLNHDNEVQADAEDCQLQESELPDLEVCDEAAGLQQQSLVENEEKEAVVESNIASEVVENATDIESVEVSNEVAVNGCEPTQEITVSVEKSDLEKQLNDVQNQLAALSSLPSTIQTMLESVSRQLNELMPAFKLHTSIELTGNINETSTLQINEKIDFEKESNTDELHVDKVDDTATTTTDITDTESQIKETGEVSVEVCTTVDEDKQNTVELTNDDIARATEEQILKMKTERTFQLQEEDWARNKVSHKQKNLSMDDRRKRIADDIVNQPQRNNGPRTPQERPMVLPGGRKWRNAKDAYNEEFIAEIISSQAELIMGSTLGYAYDSVVRCARFTANHFHASPFESFGHRIHSCSFFIL